MLFKLIGEVVVFRWLWKTFYNLGYKVGGALTRKPQTEGLRPSNTTPPVPLPGPRTALTRKIIHAWIERDHD